jgi:hypothetical protein
MHYLKGRDPKWICYYQKCDREKSNKIEHFVYFKKLGQFLLHGQLKNIE